MRDTKEMLANLRGRAREIERSSLRIRKFANLSSYAKLDPYDLANKLGMKVTLAKDLPEISVELAQRLLVNKASEWSGASSGILPDGLVIILLNNTQSKQRRAATLMEEICHVLLGHQRDYLPTQLTEKRSYNSRQEDEAFAVGAAALAPYMGIKYFLEQNWTLDQIAQHFGVTKSLILYRLELTALKH
jgi:Zn-dependent peptidase ImmA (M78 family)